MVHKKLRCRQRQIKTSECVIKEQTINSVRFRLRGIRLLALAEIRTVNNDLLFTEHDVT